ncbi:MAG: flagellar motor protein MotB [Kangiellaceae bacterium]|jgi:chemotaxis protein MotB|nr:flagellar motor protein MotB [Kangiellaceae bacterium]
MLRKTIEHEESSNERWLVSYADFITLMFAFFVVMYSISQVNEGKYRVLAESIESAFDSSARTVVPISLGQEIPRSEQPELTGEPNTLDQPQSSSDEAEPENYATPEEFDRIEQTLSTQLAPLIDESLVAIRKTRDWLEIDLRSALLFESGSDRLANSARVVINEIAGSLSNNEHLISVRGHTDNIPIDTPRFPSNWALSSARSVAVVQLLQSLNIVPQRLSAQGLGEFQPIESNVTASGRATNRRVTIAVSRYKLQPAATFSADATATNDQDDTVAKQADDRESVLATEESQEPNYEVVKLPGGGLLIRGKKLPKDDKD